MSTFVDYYFPQKFQFGSAVPPLSFADEQGSLGCRPRVPMGRDAALRRLTLTRESGFTTRVNPDSQRHAATGGRR